jgi:galactose-3-O-sulfotransferase 3
MAYDFGMDRKNFNDTYEKQQLFDTIDEDFDLVMISEYMEASLVLLADLMCWPLRDVRFLKLNARPEKIKQKFNKREIKKLNILNNVDTELYRYYLEKFKIKIEIYGKKRMENDVLKLINLNNNLMDECVSMLLQPKLDNRTYPVIQYELKINAPSHCNFVIMKELNFTEILRDQQIYKFDVIQKFNNLFHS